MAGLGNLLHETTHVSRPLVPTVLIHTGPKIHPRDGHFLAGERPVRGWFRMAQTFWAGHRPLLLKEMWRRVPLDEKDGTSKIPSFERGVVFDRRLMGKFQLNTAQLTRYAIQHESDITMPIPAQPEPRPLIAQDAICAWSTCHIGAWSARSGRGKGIWKGC